MSVFVFGILGLIIGSFLNVVVLRRGARALEGRSACMSCGKLLAWYDMIPVFSWLMLFGRCRHCGSRISVQYPLVEGSTAVLFALIGGAPHASFFYQTVACIIIALLVAIAAYDFLHTIIPDAWAYSFAGLALVCGLVFGLVPGTWYLELIAGPIAALPLFLLWLVSAGKWMGLGDAKLALGIGWLLGPAVGIVAIMSSFILGTLILIPWMLAGRLITHMQGGRSAATGITMKSEVPFGPFLILSCLLFWLSQLYGVPLTLGLFGL